MIPWKGIGIAVGAAVSGAFAGVTAAAATVRRSDPAAIEALREDLREFRHDTNMRLDTMNQRLSTLEGYAKAKAEASK